MLSFTSAAGLVLDDLFKNLFVSPTLLRVVRVFRVGRILRLVKSAKGIRTLLFSLAVSLPALFNIGLLLFLVMFIYAIFGMSFFMHVKHTKGLDDMFNFETFHRSMIILFQISTSAGWDGVLAGLINDRVPECNNTQTEERPNGDCGSSGLAIMYLVTYLIISFLVVINMYIAVILENFSQATEDVQQGLTQDDFDMYYEVWERYDEKATEYIQLEKLCEFVDALEEPLRIAQPNFYKLVTLDIPICVGDTVHCVDILDALTKNFLTTDGDTDQMGDLKKGPEREGYTPVSTLMKRQREVFAATVVQKAWWSYQERKHHEAVGEDLLRQLQVAVRRGADCGDGGGGGSRQLNTVTEETNTLDDSSGEASASAAPTTTMTRMMMENASNDNTERTTIVAAATVAATFTAAAPAAAAAMTAAATAAARKGV